VLKAAGLEVGLNSKEDEAALRSSSGPAQSRFSGYRVIAGIKAARGEVDEIEN